MKNESKKKSSHNHSEVTAVFSSLWKALGDIGTAILSVLVVISDFILQMLLVVAKIFQTFCLVLLSFAGALALVTLSFYLVFISFGVSESTVFQEYRDKTFQVFFSYYEQKHIQNSASGSGNDIIIELKTEEDISLWEMDKAEEKK